MYMVGILLLLASIAANSAYGQTEPGLLPRPPRHGNVYVIAHRGAHDGVPENTLAAYERAIELGADFVEIDVRTTQYGRLVSIHNATVDAYTIHGTRGAVRDHSLEALQAIDIGSRIGQVWKDERVPTYEAILDRCRDRIMLYIDVKDAAIDALLAPLRSRGMERHAVWYADDEKLAVLAERCPACISMPDPGAEANLAALLDIFEPAVVASVWRHYSPSFVQACHERQALVFVDDGGPATWADAIGWGSDGIQTDDPAGLIAELAKHRAREGDCDDE